MPIPITLDDKMHVVMFAYVAGRPQITILKRGPQAACA